MKNSDPKQRAHELRLHHDIMSYSIAPTDCFHRSIERYFEWEKAADKPPCGQCCSYCLGEVERWTKRVNKDGVISFLSTKLTVAGKPLSCSDLIKALKASKSNIFHPDDVPKKQMGQIHALGLQLIANGLIVLSVSDRTKVGTEDLKQEHLVVNIGIGKKKKKGRSHSQPAYMIDKYWEGMNTYVDESDSDSSSDESLHA